MQRITQTNLELLADTINRETNNPRHYATMVDGERKGANIGHYHINYAYGGCKLVQTMNPGGGIRCITDGYLPKRELYDLMHAYLSGLRAAKP